MRVYVNNTCLAFCYSSKFLNVHSANLFNNICLNKLELKLNVTRIWNAYSELSVIDNVNIIIQFTQNKCILL